MPDGLDIAKWQAGIPIASLKPEGIYFVIHKASGANGGGLYVDSKYNEHVPAIRAQGIRIGHYFFNGSVDPTQSANYFVDHLNGYTPDDILALDIEGEDQQGVSWAFAWFAQIKRRIPDAKLYLYTTQSIVRQYDWSPVVQQGVRLWIAAPGDNSPYTGEFGDWAIHQYTWTASIAGFGPLDGNHSRDDVWTRQRTEEDELADVLAEVKQAILDSQTYLANVIRRESRPRVYQINQPGSKRHSFAAAIDADEGYYRPYGSAAALQNDVRLSRVAPELLQVSEVEFDQLVADAEARLAELTEDIKE